MVALKKGATLKKVAIIGEIRLKLCLALLRERKGLSVLLFAGDPHGNFGAIERACERFRPEMLVLLGDLVPSVPLDEALSFALKERIEVLWIPGNHEADDAGMFERTFGSALAGNNLHASVAEACGIRIAGLGGKFHKEVWMPPDPPRFASRGMFLKGAKETLKPLSLVTIFPEDIQKLSRHRANILVSHVAPSTHPHGFFILDDLALAMGARLIVHAHHHRANYMASLKNRTLVCGVGSGLALLDLEKRTLELFQGWDLTKSLRVELGKGSCSR